MSTASSKLKVSSQGAGTTVEPAEHKRADKGNGAYPEKGASSGILRNAVSNYSPRPPLGLEPKWLRMRVCVCVRVC
eukprot:10620132-Alexandrium_andersonii.AAC.1